MYRGFHFYECRADKFGVLAEFLRPHNLVTFCHVNVECRVMKHVSACQKLSVPCPKWSTESVDSLRFFVKNQKLENFKFRENRSWMKFIQFLTKGIEVWISVPNILPQTRFLLLCTWSCITKSTWLEFLWLDIVSGVTQPPEAHVKFLIVGPIFSKKKLSGRGRRRRKKISNHYDYQLKKLLTEISPPHPCLLKKGSTFH
jgi:hypothetical protein